MAATDKTPYERLEERWTKLSHLTHATSILDWDEATMMPTGSSSQRGEAVAGLELMKHELICAPETQKDLQNALQTKHKLTDWQQSNLFLMQRIVDRSALLPPRLVEETSKATSASQMAWREHRKNNDWHGMLPHFENVFQLRKEAAQILSQKMGRSPYECLMDMYEANLSEARVNQLFESLRAFLPEFLKKVLAAQSQMKTSKPSGPFAVEKQQKIGRMIAEKIGFDFQHGRLDISHHPFCGGTQRDVRITTRYTTDDFLSSLFGVLHETGHAKYEQNLPLDWGSQPVGRALGMMVHESQSLITEMQISKGSAFLKFLLPLLKAEFASPADDPAAWELKNFIRNCSWVKPDFIRVEADEVTYPLHIVLRYEIERDLVNGTLQVKDIPAVWDEKMKSYLGIDTRGNYKNGCLQDIHWPAGLVGYFPCYTLGALMAAQLFQSLKTQHPQVDQELSEGSFKTVNHWLRENVYSKASLYPAEQLITKVTGKALDTDAFIHHLQERYLKNR